MKQYVVDAFTDKIFHGNQAAVCVMDRWLPEDLMRISWSIRPPAAAVRCTAVWRGTRCSWRARPHCFPPVSSISDEKAL